ncbi:MAG: hypothetical protein HZA80_02600 [Candidatus Taylorbacteria bacterium]|nr:hypothetical protein [Candidatus Taylorbacteria bacterium]
MNTRPLALCRLVQLHDQGILPSGWVSSFTKRFGVNPIEEARLTIMAQEKENRCRSRIGIRMIIASLLLLLLVILKGDLSVMALEKYGLIGLSIPFIAIIVIGGILYFRVPTTSAPNADRFCETLEKAADLVQLEVEICASNPNDFIRRARAFLAIALLQHGNTRVHHEGYEVFNLLGVVH